MIQGCLLTAFLSLVSLYHVDAFLSDPFPHTCTARPSQSTHHLLQVVKSSDLSPLSQPLTHTEIIWKLRPPQGTPFTKKLLLRLGANVIRLESALRGVDPPFCLCPKGGQAILEAYYQGMHVYVMIYRVQVCDFSSHTLLKHIAYCSTL